MDENTAPGLDSVNYTHFVITLADPIVSTTTINISAAYFGLAIIYLQWFLLEESDIPDL